jgi:lipopolysaccharide transport system permease protein
MQAWMFLTPVVYPNGIVPHGWEWLMQLNPMAVVIEGARWAVVPGASPPDLVGLMIFACEFIALFIGGVVTFRKIDAIIADRI